MSDYDFIHDGKVLTPNQTPGVSPAESDARNKAIEAQELETWAAQPERFLAYYRFIGHEQEPRTAYRHRFMPSLIGASVSTWTGRRLGTITTALVYPHNFGGRFVSMRVKGSNGAIYAGRASWDHGECIWLRKVNR